MAAKELPPLELLKEILTVNEETGETYRRFKNGKVKQVGNLDSSGYYQIKIKQKKYPLHRVLWALYNNKLPTPDEVIDHKNRDKTDNSRENLRIVSHSQNCYNWVRKNKHEATGISYDKRNTNRPWRASITIKSKFRHIGNYSTKEEAIQARLQAEKELGIYIYRE